MSYKNSHPRNGNHYHLALIQPTSFSNNPVHDLAIDWLVIISETYSGSQSYHNSPFQSSSMYLRFLRNPAVVVGKTSVDSVPVLKLLTWFYSLWLQFGLQKLHSTQFAASLRPSSPKSCSSVLAGSICREMAEPRSISHLKSHFLSLSLTNSFMDSCSRIKVFMSLLWVP